MHSVDLAFGITYPDTPLEIAIWIVVLAVMGYCVLKVAQLLWAAFS